MICSLAACASDSRADGDPEHSDEDRFSQTTITAEERFMSLLSIEKKERRCFYENVIMVAIKLRYAWKTLFPPLHFVHVGLARRGFFTDLYPIRNITIFMNFSPRESLFLTNAQ